MLHNIRPKIYHVEYEDRAPGPDDTVFLFDGDAVWRRPGDGGTAFPKFGELRGVDGVSFRYLFAVDDERFFIPDVKNIAEVKAPDGYERGEIGMFRGLRPRHLAFAATTARELYLWYDSRKFCGKSGAGTVHAGAERSVVCPGCGLTEYPKISPVVIVAVSDGERLLVTRYRDRPYRRYALVAGFGEIGESLEDTARREVFEETGVRVKDLRYYKSQPWGFSSSLLAGFFCKLDGDPAITVDERELSEAVWLPRDEIPPAEEDIALTAEMMEAFRTGREPRS